MDTVVYGISLDDVATQKAFVSAQKLNFSLLSDSNGGVTRAYEVMMKGRPLAQRVTFIIDDKGVVRHIDTGVKVDTHGMDLVDRVRTLQDE